MCKMIIGCIQLGYVPALIADERVEMTPVDYVSQAIVALSRRKASLGQAFHLFNPATISVSSLVTWVNELGYPVQQTTYETWLNELTRATEGEASTENALAPLVPLFPKEGPEEQREEQVPRRPFDNRNALLGLAGTSITCPQVDARLLATYLSYLVRSGFLPALHPADMH
jgi:thioester reductase-like protein